MFHAPDILRFMVVEQSDLDRAIDGCVIAPWEAKKWKRVKTLAAAASGQGTVELMISQEQPTHCVAVKQLPWALLQSCPEEFNKMHPSASERPWMDIAVVTHLNSLRFPCACQFLGVFLGDEQAYIMTSFATRGDLFSWCQNDTSDPGVARETAMRPVLSQMFAGVCWLHNIGIAHRDLSCENVLLTDNSENEVQVKIIDFGMACLSRRVAREVRGKRSYQAPEMHAPAEFDTFLADIFSVGVTTYCMAVHYYPWEHTKPGKDRSFEFARMNGVSIFLSKKRLPCNKKPVAEVYSRSFVNLLCGLLAPDPEERCSLGETCFEKDSRESANSADSWLTEAPCKA